MEREKTPPINNAFYDDLKEKWHNCSDHPIALLRAENQLRNPWIQKIIKSHFKQPCKVLDIGCGGGFLTNYLAEKGHRVSGIDLSSESLEIAKKHDQTKRVAYQRASACELPFENHSFDAVCAMDLLEHVKTPALVVREASRILKKGGLFFFHTFNRNFLSYFMVIKAVEWCFANAPENLHVYPLFLKPKELKQMCQNHQMTVVEIKGMRPCYKNRSFWKMVFQRTVDDDFSFVFTSSLKTGYTGYAKKLYHANGY